MADRDVQGMLVRIEVTTAQLRQEMARADSSVGQASGKIDNKTPHTRQPTRRGPRVPKA